MKSLSDKPSVLQPKRHLPVLLSRAAGVCAAALLGLALPAATDARAEPAQGNAQWSGAPGNLSAKSLTAPLTGATKHFQVKSDTPWTLAPDQPWAVVSPASGCTGVFDITVEIKSGSAERNAAIKFSNGKATAWVPVAQVAQDGYYKDGDVIVLHRAAPPAGILPVPIFFIGDGWDMSDFKKGGLWETYTRALTKILLNVDIVKDFTNRFDIYAYCAESELRGKRGFNVFGTSSRSGTDFDKMSRLAQKYLATINHPNAKNATYIAASNAPVGGYAMAGTYAIVSIPSGQHTYAYWMVHEYVGHVLANMPDLYFGNPGWVLDRDAPKEYDPVSKRWFPSTYNKGTVKDVRNMVANFNREWKRGYDWNVDWTDNPKEAVWKDFVGKPGYENVGAFPTGWNVFGGFMGPENFDAMRNLDHLWFSVGSRMWLWNRIQERSGIGDPPSYFSEPDADHPRSLKNFKAFDIKHRYNTNGKNVNTFVEDPVLTHQYWVANDIYPDRADEVKSESNQHGKPLLSLAPASIVFGAAGGVQTAVVSSNKVKWTATSSASWLTVANASGNGNGVFTLKAARSASPRTATITLTDNDGGALPRKITVTQR